MAFTWVGLRYKEPRLWRLLISKENVNYERDILRDNLHINSGCSIRYRHMVCQVVRMCTLIPYSH